VIKTASIGEGLLGTFVSVLALLLAAGVLIVACTAAGTIPSSAPGAVIGTGSVIDGFTLGSQAACSSGVGPVPSGVVGCGSYPELAVATLDARDGSHAAIVSTAMFTDGSRPGPIDVTGDASPPVAGSDHAGSVDIVFVFTLADGSIHATGVKCSESGPCVGVDRGAGS
jgi:hypothetical protein